MLISTYLSMRRRGGSGPACKVKGGEFGARDEGEAQRRLRNRGSGTMLSPGGANKRGIRGRFRMRSDEMSEREGSTDIADPKRAQTARAQSRHCNKVEKQRREIVPVTPYLFFDGRCEEAIEFYKKALGAEVGMMMRFNESPEKPPPGMVPPGSENKIMHACIRINGADVMASDGNANGKPKFEGFSLTLNANNEAAADRMFAALADGGQVQMPLGKTFFAKRFGMVADRFGVGWMIIVEP